MITLLNRNEFIIINNTTMEKKETKMSAGLLEEPPKAWQGVAQMACPLSGYDRKLVLLDMQHCLDKQGSLSLSQLQEFTRQLLPKDPTD
jgi:hypothetical protein